MFTNFFFNIPRNMKIREINILYDDHIIECIKNFLEMMIVEDEHPLGELVIPVEGLLKEELQEEIEERIAFTVENLYHLDNELDVFVQLVKDNVETNKNSPDELMTLYNYLDEMWSVLITNDLRDVLLDTLSIVQARKHELEDILEEIEETLEKQEEINSK